MPALTSCCSHWYNRNLSAQEVTLPLYEYRCEQCGSQIEKIQKFSDPPLTTCDKCGGELARLLSPPAIQFKGSGWYITDYARKSASSQSGSSDGSSSNSSASESSASKGKSSDSKAPVNK
ncbi:MAG TPA: FmdB family zinc ribbon protein [Terriglobia bacterium]|nr:FmdB family zinc ribbon protein [Terriglobia bacterium]